MEKVSLKCSCDANITVCVRIDYQQKERRNVKVEPAAEADPDFPNKTRNFVVAGMIAVGAMVAYATSTGIIQVRLLKEKCCPT